MYEQEKNNFNKSIDLKGCILGAFFCQVCFFFLVIEESEREYEFKANANSVTYEDFRIKIIGMAVVHAQVLLKVKLTKQIVRKNCICVYALSLCIEIHRDKKTGKK